jgi:flagellar hook-length control protein FliK
MFSPSTTAAAAAPAAPQAPTPFTPDAFATLVAAARGGDGTQTLTLRTHPEDLGPVEVTVQVHQGVVSVALSSSSPSARDAMSDHLADLRSSLAEAGLQLGSVGVGSGRAGTGAPPAPPPGAGATADDAAATAPVPPTRPEAPAHGGVDLHM